MWDTGALLLLGQGCPVEGPGGVHGFILSLRELLAI